MPSFTFCPQCNTKYRTAGMPAFKPAATDKKYMVEGEIARGGMGVPGRILKTALPPQRVYPQSRWTTLLSIESVSVLAHRSGDGGIRGLN